MKVWPRASTIYVFTSASHVFSRSRLRAASQPPGECRKGEPLSNFLNAIEDRAHRVLLPGVLWPSRLKPIALRNFDQVHQLRSRSDSQARVTGRQVRYYQRTGCRESQDVRLRCLRDKSCPALSRIFNSAGPNNGARAMAVKAQCWHQVEPVAREDGARGSRIGA